MRELPAGPWEIGRRFLTFLAVQIRTQVLRAARGLQHPGSIRERRLMPHVLAMATSQIGHPVAVFILVIADNGLFQGAIPSRAIEIASG